MQVTLSRLIPEFTEEETETRIVNVLQLLILEKVAFWFMTFFTSNTNYSHSCRCLGLPVLWSQRWSQTWWCWGCLGRLPLANQERQQDGRHSSETLMFLLKCQVVTLSGLSDFSICPSQASAAVTFSSPHTMSLSRLNKLVSGERQREPTWPGKALGKNQDGE